jgi:hypothetical protein
MACLVGCCTEGRCRWRLAAVAMCTVITAISVPVSAADRLYEYSFYLDMLTSCLTQARGYNRGTQI